MVRSPFLLLGLGLWLDEMGYGVASGRRSGRRGRFRGNCGIRGNCGKCRFFGNSGFRGEHGLGGEDVPPEVGGWTEVQDQADLQIGCAEVVQQLGGVHTLDKRGSLYFEDYPVGYHDIGAVVSDVPSMDVQRVWHFGGAGQATLLNCNHQCSAVYSFEKSEAQLPIHIKERANDLLGDFRMHQRDLVLHHPSRCCSFRGIRCLREYPQPVLQPDIKRTPASFHQRRKPARRRHRQQQPHVRRPAITHCGDALR